jgi:hypothetical protein
VVGYPGSTRANLAGTDAKPMNRTLAGRPSTRGRAGEILAPDTNEAAALALLTPAGEAVLAGAQTLARRAIAPAT